MPKTNKNNLSNIEDNLERSLIVFALNNLCIDWILRYGFVSIPVIEVKKVIKKYETKTKTKANKPLRKKNNSKF